MLQECIEVFEKELMENPNLILDTYIPAEGTYLIVHQSGEISRTEIVMDKKKHDVNREQKYFNEICFYDYYSKLIEMNKPMESGKIIQSNNYYSFVVKKENVENGKLNADVINNYYNTLANPFSKYEKKPNAVKLYEMFSEDNPDIEIDILEKHQQWIQDHIFCLEEYGVSLEKKDYLKIFFEADIDKYITEWKRYVIPNIYNSTDYNVTVDDKIYGLPNDNLGMNAKKPFLSVKTRKLAASYLLDTDRVLVQKQFFDYLMNFAAVGSYNVFVDLSHMKIMGYDNTSLPHDSFSGFFLRLLKEKNEAAILHFDQIPYYIYSLKQKFSFINYMNYNHKNHEDWNDDYKSYFNRNELQGLINEILFSKCLLNNYFTPADKLSINDGYLKWCIINYRDSIFNWIYKGIEEGIDSIFKELTLHMIKGTIQDGYNSKAVRQLNLRWSFINYFGGKDNMGNIIRDIQTAIGNKINSKDTLELENDQQYYFCVGQLISFFLSMNKSKNTMQSLANPFFNAKRDEIIKERLMQLYKKYNYNIDRKSKRFNNMYTMVLGYLPEGKVNQEIIIAGFLHSNLIYYKEDRNYDE